MKKLQFVKDGKAVSFEDIDRMACAFFQCEYDPKYYAYPVPKGVSRNSVKGSVYISLNWVDVLTPRLFKGSDLEATRNRINDVFTSDDYLPIRDSYIRFIDYLIENNYKPIILEIMKKWIITNNFSVKYNTKEEAQAAYDEILKSLSDSQKDEFIFFYHVAPYYM